LAIFSRQNLHISPWHERCAPRCRAAIPHISIYPGRWYCGIRRCFVTKIKLLASLCRFDEVDSDIIRKSSIWALDVRFTPEDGVMAGVLVDS
jgi:hypothetical protein